MNNNEECIAYRNEMLTKFVDPLNDITYLVSPTYHTARS